jgi:hypothetical protein
LSQGERFSSTATAADPDPDPDPAPDPRSSVIAVQWQAQGLSHQCTPGIGAEIQSQAFDLDKTGTPGNILVFH